MNKIDFLKTAQLNLYCVEMLWRGLDERIPLFAKCNQEPCRKYCFTPFPLTARWPHASQYWPKQDHTHAKRKILVWHLACLVL